MLKRYIITIIVGAALGTLSFFLVGGASASGLELLLAFCNAFSVSGILLICIGLLVFVSNHGAFDMIAYGTQYVLGLMIRKPDKSKYRDYYDYTEKKHQNKTRFGYILAVGGAYLFVGIVLTVIYNICL